MFDVARGIISVFKDTYRYNAHDFENCMCLKIKNITLNAFE